MSAKQTDHAWLAYKGKPVTYLTWTNQWGLDIGKARHFRSSDHAVEVLDGRRATVALFELDATGCPTKQVE